jgi:hypothetical protein
LEDGRRLFGNFGFALANPPFNVDLVDAEKITNDPRLPFGLPGASSTSRESTKPETAASSGHLKNAREGSKAGLLEAGGGYLLDLMCPGDSGSHPYENSISWQ